MLAFWSCACPCTPRPRAARGLLPAQSAAPRARPRAQPSGRAWADGGGAAPPHRSMRVLSVAGAAAVIVNGALPPAFEAGKGDIWVLEFIFLGVRRALSQPVGIRFLGVRRTPTPLPAAKPAAQRLHPPLRRRARLSAAGRP